MGTTIDAAGWPRRGEEGPAVVALGGGHGLSASLSALRLLTKRLTAVVTVAEPLSATHSKTLSDALKDVLGKEPKIEVKVDPSILGGLVVKVGSRMIDTSLRTKLNSIRTAMKEVG